MRANQKVNYLTAQCMQSEENYIACHIVSTFPPSIVGVVNKEHRVYMSHLWNQNQNNHIHLHWQ